MFKSMGHTNIGVLDGGLSAWKNGDFECEPRIFSASIRSEFTANYESDLVVNSEQILDNISNNNMILIDARSEGRFNAEIPEPRENMVSGHIPNSLNLPFNQVLKTGKMKSKTELVGIFKNFNFQNKKVVFTCGSGITACIILLAFEQVSSNKKALFDGSWSEWGQGNKFPVAKK
jgi:thiosulfate/3-mercaptopyruvate sulfurtransferase